MSRWRVGVDSGGTFTDICLFEETEGRVEVWKVSSTPDDPSRGIAQGVDEGMRRVAPEAGEQPAAPVSYFGHGTTVATNALIQHKGVPTGLVTTDGFRDLLEIGRQKRPDLYDLFADKPQTLVDARPAPRGAGAHPPRRHGRRSRSTRTRCAQRRASCARRASARSRSRFLYSFVRPEHERRAKEIVQEEYPDAFICTSHEIAPEFREFERLSTAVVNAYLGPVMKRYIDRLAPRLSALGMAVTPHLTQSNGGVIGFETAARKPVRTVLSGPVHRRRRRAGDRPRCRHARPHHLRHGRHLDRRRAAEGRRGAAHLGGDRARPPDQGADARHPHRRRRRRLDRLCRQRRPAESRPAQRRRRSGPGLLRPRATPSRRSPTPMSCCRR